MNQAPKEKNIHVVTGLAPLLRRVRSACQPENSKKPPNDEWERIDNQYHLKLSTLPQVNQFGKEAKATFNPAHFA